MNLLENHPILGLMPSLVLLAITVFCCYNARERDRERTLQRDRCARARRVHRDFEKDYSMKMIFAGVASATLAVILFLALFYAHLDQDQRTTFGFAAVSLVGAVTLLAMARCVYRRGEDSFGCALKVITAIAAVLFVAIAVYLLTRVAALGSDVLTWIF